MNEPDQALVVQPAPLPATCETPSQLLERAITSGANVEVLERLMALQERWLAAQAKRAFEAALAAVKAELPPIIKNQRVDFTSQRGRTNYAYEDIADIATVVDPIMATYGLSYRWPVSTHEGKIVVTCRISHRDGHTEDCATLEGPADQSGNKNGYQGIGSAVTYFQRYTLKAALGIAARQDDDAQSAGNRRNAPQERFERQTTQKEQQQAKTAPKADSERKKATMATLNWFILRIPKDLVPVAKQYAQQKGWMKGEDLLEWPLEHCPVSVPEADAVVQDIQRWSQYDPEPQPSAPPETSENELPVEIADVICPVPHKGEERTKYMENPETIGQLYYEMKEGNQESQKRLWGFALNYEPKGWVNRKGEQMPPNELDVKFRAGLDAYQQWHQEQEQKRQGKMDLVP